ncbi:hypothetical protein [Enterococcus casseliflavus]|uniref:hypothetical protein n=1 Tax=Enterococcus casseliflavus TaxID=37734 RepID=UPI002DBB30AF|nr:hypothetical protein [Enterococcus casseliflavus]MEB6147358.1 hypothetical protein [Enterococcus casseliflavus]
MKQIIIDALTSGKIVKFYFVGESNYFASELLDTMEQYPDQIYVGQSIYDQDSVVNLNQVTRVKIT